MALTIDEVKKNVAYKQLPIVILDERWHRLFPENEKTAQIRTLEKQLGELLKRQGKITNDLKAVKNIKNKLMQEVLTIADRTDIPEAKKQKQLSRNQQLILESKEKIEALEDEELELPKKIRDCNILLVIEGTQACYNRIHQNYEDIQLLGKWINEVRIALKKKVLIKQDKEIKNTEIYSYMHDLLGPEMMEVFDTTSGNK